MVVRWGGLFSEGVLVVQDKYGGASHDTGYIHYGPVPFFVLFGLAVVMNLKSFKIVCEYQHYINIILFQSSDKQKKISY